MLRRFRRWRVLRRVDVLVLEPDDVLVIFVDSQLSHDTLSLLRDEARRRSAGSGSRSSKAAAGSAWYGRL